MRVALATVGCKLNQADTDALRAELEGAGHEIVPWDAPADVCIVNTCTVTARADADSRKLLRRARRSHPGALVIAVGCYAEVDPDELRALDAVDWVVGREAVSDVARALGDGRYPRRLARAPASHLQVRPVAPTRARAYLVVQDGCNRRCAYCRVPYARGPERSLPVADVVAEAQRLASRGHGEIVLVGCNLGTYGHDLQPQATLAELLVTLASRDLPRIRLSSVEPDLVTDDLCSAIAGGGDKICPHLHVPVQSGSADVLMRMGRSPDTDTIVERVARLRDQRPLLALGLDLMVGFPGETEEDFADTTALLERLQPTRLHVFPYSPRKGTPAFGLPDALPPSERRARARQLRQAGDVLARRFQSAHLGQDVVVLVETFKPDGMALGTTETYVAASLAARAILWPGQLVRGHVRGLDGNRVSVGDYYGAAGA